MRPRWIIAAGAGAAVLLTAWLLARPTTPALASADPADGAVLVRAPSGVELTFTAAPDPARSHVWVRDGAGSPVSAGTLAAVGADRLRQPIEPTATGALTVTYHAEFAHGSELVGVIHFTVGAAGPSTAAPPAHDHGVDPVGAALLVVDGIVGLAVVVLLLRRPRPKQVPKGPRHPHG